MDSILNGIEHVACYIDDIIITGKTDEEHVRHLEEVSNVYYVMEYVPSGINATQLGHRVDAEGSHTTEDKLQAIVQAPTLKNVQELRSILGLINYYGKFIPYAATILHPLNNLLRKDAKWKWSKSCRELPRRLSRC